MNIVQKNFGGLSIPSIINPRFQTFIKCKWERDSRQKYYKCHFNNIYSGYFAAGVIFWRQMLAQKHICVWKILIAHIFITNTFKKYVQVKIRFTHIILCVAKKCLDKISIILTWSTLFIAHYLIGFVSNFLHIHHSLSMHYTIKLAMYETQKMNYLEILNILKSCEVHYNSYHDINFWNDYSLFF